MYPSYLNLSSREWKERIDKAYEILKSCSLCGRCCGINRISGEKGFCNGGILPKISSYNLHFGEEPSISGTRGSGTIFFTGCSMRCCFCQNYPISQLGVGNEIKIEKLSKIMLSLQRSGAHNINLVTPTHFVPQILASLKIASENGLKIPIVYNTGGYDTIETLNLLDSIVDVYMPDSKYGNDEASLKFSESPGYVKINKKAIIQMWKQVGDLEIVNGIAKRGILVRHLVLPNNISHSDEVLRFLQSVSKNMYVSLMSQYFPCNRAYQYPELSRRITKKEYERAYKTLKKLGLRGYTQSLLSS